MTMPKTSLRPLEIVAVLLVLFLAGWFAYLIVTDIRALKTNIGALRVYLQSLPAPNECNGPGMQASSLSCEYKIKITDAKNGDKGLYKGIIDASVYAKSKEQCEQAMQSLKPEFKDLKYECESPDMQPYKDVVYVFYVDGNPKLKVNEVYDFENVSGSTHLIKMEADK
jgi:hypothetical protein